RLDGSRPSNRSVDPPLFAHQPVHPPRGSDETVNPADAVYEAVRATESVDEAIHPTSAVDQPIDFPGPAGRRLGTRSTDEPLAPADPPGQESDGRRNGRRLRRRLRLVTLLCGGLDRRIDAHRLLEFLDEPIEDRGLREFEFLRTEGLLYLADEEAATGIVKFRSPPLRPLRLRFRARPTPASPARRPQCH